MSLYESIYETQGELGHVNMQDDNFYVDSLCNLIINYLPHDVDDLLLKNIFAEHGDITMAKVIRDKMTKKSLGYGFVKYLHKDSAMDAIQKKNGITIGSKVLKVSLARPPSDNIRNCKLYVTNLPKEYTELDVIDLFKQFGDIIECRVLKDPNTRLNRGVAFVQFDVRIQAQNGLSLNGYRPRGSDRSLVVKYAEDQQRRKQDRRFYPFDGHPGLLLGPGAELLPMGMRGAAPGLPNYPYLYQGGQMRIPGSVAMPVPQMAMPMINHAIQWSPLPPNPGASGGRGGQIHGHPSQIMYSSGLSPGRHSASRGKHSGRSHMQSNMGGPAVWYSSTPLNVQTAGAMSQNGLGGGFISSLESSLDEPSQQHYGASSRMMVSDDFVSGPTSQHNINQAGNRFSKAIPSHHQGGQYKFAGSSSMAPITLHISNLPEDSDMALLHSLLSPYGQVLGAHVEVTDTEPGTTGESSSRSTVCSGRGRVQVAGMAAAIVAVQALNGAMIFEGSPPLQVAIPLEESGNSHRGASNLSSAGAMPMGQLAYSVPSLNSSEQFRRQVQQIHLSGPSSQPASNHVPGGASLEYQQTQQSIHVQSSQLGAHNILDNDAGSSGPMYSVGAATGNANTSFAPTQSGYHVPRRR